MKDDSISRQAVIKAINNMVKECDSVYVTSALRNLEAIVADLPSEQPELPEWAQKVEEYRKSAPSFVCNQLVWALYQTWKEYDGRLMHQRGKEN